MSNKEIVFTKHSPYLVVSGSLENEDGTSHNTPMVYSLCRCGESTRKPYCDGSHGKIHFCGECEEEKNNKVREYQNDKITVYYDSYLCRHAGECVTHLPDVFNPAKRPWIDVNHLCSEGEIEKLKETIKKCPTGALSYSENGKTETNFTDTPRVIVRKDGPFDVQGGIKLVDDLETKQKLCTENHYSLCRCGKSKRIPLCDGTHRDINFKG